MFGVILSEFPSTSSGSVREGVSVKGGRKAEMTQAG